VTAALAVAFVVIDKNRVAGLQQRRHFFLAMAQVACVP
jgi:hypothetical protein